MRLFALAAFLCSTAALAQTPLPQFSAGTRAIAHISAGNSGTVTSVSAGAPAAATDANGITVATGSTTATLSLEYADGTHPGILSTGAQTIAGNKTFTGSISASGLTGVDVSFAAVGSSPSANGATVAANVVTLQPADGTHPGLVTTSAQTFAGTKTFGVLIGSSFQFSGSSGNWASITGNQLLLVNTGNSASATMFFLGPGSTNMTTGDLLHICSNTALSTCPFVVTQAGNLSLAGTGSNTAGTLDITSTTAANNAITIPTGTFLCLNGHTCTVYFENTSSTLLTISSTAVTVTGKLTAGGVLGSPGLNNQPTSLPTCSSTNEGFQYWDSTSGIATGHRTRLCLCTSNGSSSYAWQNIVSATVGNATTCND